MSKKPHVQMSFKDFSGIFRMIRSESDKQDAYIRSIPSDISAAFFDNKYVTSLHIIQDELVRRVFPPQMTSDVEFMLYECKYSKDKPAIGVGTDTGTRSYYINSIDDMLAYFDHEYEFTGE